MFFIEIAVERIRREAMLCLVHDNYVCCSEKVTQVGAVLVTLIQIVAQFIERLTSGLN